MSVKRKTRSIVRLEPDVPFNNFSFIGNITDVAYLPTEDVGTGAGALLHNTTTGENTILIYHEDMGWFEL